MIHKYGPKSQMGQAISLQKITIQRILNDTGNDAGHTYIQIYKYTYIHIYIIHTYILFVYDYEW